MQLVRVKVNLRKSSVTERQRAALVNPCCGGLRCGNVYLVFTAGSDGVTELSHDIFLGQSINKAAVVLLGNEISAVSVNALGKYIGHLSEIRAESVQYRRLVLIACSAGLGLVTVQRLSSKRD